MQQPDWYEVKGKEKFVCRLKKRLYGLKHARRQRYLKFDNVILNVTLIIVFIWKEKWWKLYYSVLFVDDILVARSNMQEINVLKRKLANSFAMKDLEAAKQILGMRICRDKKNCKLTLSQNEYIQKVLKRFNMQNAKPVSTPFSIHFKLSKEMCPKTPK